MQQVTKVEVDTYSLQFDWKIEGLNEFPWYYDHFLCSQPLKFETIPLTVYIKFYPTTRPMAAGLGMFTFSVDENDFTKQHYLSFGIRVGGLEFQKNLSGEWEKLVQRNYVYNGAANEHTFHLTIKCQVGRVCQPQPGLEEENLEVDTSVIETVTEPQAPQAAGEIPVVDAITDQQEFVMVEQGEDYVDAVEAVESEAISETDTMATVNHHDHPYQTPIEILRVETSWSDYQNYIQILEEKSNPDETVAVANTDENGKADFELLDEEQVEILTDDLKKEILALVQQILPDETKFHSFDSAGTSDEDRQEFFDALFAATDLNSFFAVMNCADKLKAEDLKDKIVKQFIIKQSSKELLKSAAWQELKNHKQLFEETVEKVLPLVLKNEKIIF